MSVDDLKVERDMLKTAKTIAVVGISDKEHRSSYGVADYLSRYYTVIPVNPKLTEWNGKKAYPSLSEVPDDINIDIIDVFRRSEFVPEIIDQAIARGVPNVWLQLGVVDEAAAAKGRAEGINVVMDQCIAVIHSQLSRTGELEKS